MRCGNWLTGGAMTVGMGLLVSKPFQLMILVMAHRAKCSKLVPWWAGMRWMCTAAEIERHVEKADVKLLPYFREKAAEVVKACEDAA